MYRVYFISSYLFHLGLPKYHKINKLKVNFVGYILLYCWLVLTNIHYLLALVTNDSRIIIIKINREIFAKYWVNLKQLMRNFEILWRKSKKINTKNPDSDHHHRQKCSAQGQVLHCKFKNVGCSSAERRSSTANSGNKAAVLPGIE